MSNINELKAIMARLRDPENGCPWDVEQDFLSITAHTIEEAYEVVDAIEQQDMPALKEELGDLLLQVIFYSQMASEENIFNFDQVVDVLNAKLISRHPHVFGDKEIKTAQEQEESWEEIKEQERKNKATPNSPASALDGVAAALPALTRSYKIQKRASKVGFDWPDLTGVFGKIEEEIGELKEAIEENSNIEEEFGDTLFALVNLGRKLKIDPEQALRKGNAKFIKRFAYMEQELQKNDINIKDAKLDVLDKFWEKGKKAVG